jgi:hypothetical protein
MKNSKKKSKMKKFEITVYERYSTVPVEYYETLSASYSTVVDEVFAKHKHRNFEVKQIG